MMHIKKIIISLALFGLLSCGPKLLYPGIANQGILALSPENAYLGSNRFLATEIEQDPILLSFFRSRGGPQAIQLIQNGQDKLELVLYYSEPSESYVAERDISEQVSGLSYNWVVRGPFPFSRHEFKLISGLMPDSAKQEPIFLLFGNEQKLKPTHAETPTNSKIIVTAQIPKTPPAPKPRIVYRDRPVEEDKKSHSPSGHSSPSVSAINPARPMNSDQIALAMARGYAERTLVGDIVHTIRSEPESLEAIARWYTGDASSLAKILESNKRTAEQELKPGERITIPAALVKNDKLMPADFK